VHTNEHKDRIKDMCVPRGEVPGLGLIDEDVDLLKGDECDILA
jgi:hypothetical protein